MNGEIFISYWRTDFTRIVRICRVREFSTPEVLASFRIAGRKLAYCDVKRAEAVLKEMAA